MTLLDSMLGPTEDEYINYFNDNPQGLLNVSIRDSFYRGIETAFANGAKISDATETLEMLMQRLYCGDLINILKSHNFQIPEDLIKIDNSLHDELASDIVNLLIRNGLDANDLILSYFLNHIFSDDCFDLFYWAATNKKFPSLILTTEKRCKLFDQKVKQGDLYKVKVLMAIGIKPQSLKKAFCEAAYHGKVEIVRFLYNERTTLEFDKELALSNAVSCHTNDGHIDTIEYLLALGANVEEAKSKHSKEWGCIRDKQVKSFLRSKGIDYNNI